MPEASSWMMEGMGIMWLLAVIVLFVGVGALIVYLRAN